MRSWRRQQGQHGEQLAVQFLQRQGYRIQQQNYRCRGGEVDIIAWDGPTLVFIEVKTKGQTAFGAPQAMVGGQKQKKIVHVAMVYVQQHQMQDVNIRFDVVAITLLPGVPHEVTHVPGAFTAPSHFLY
jgi:putative endonuclease